jgi:pilus assembly protein CpaB
VSPSIPRPPRRRLPLPRRPVPFWALAVLLAVLTAAVAARGLGATGAGAPRHDEAVPVLVVSRPVAAGQPVEEAVAQLRPVPADLVPAGAVRTAADGRVATVDLHPGEVVLAARLAPDGLSPTAALLPPGTRGVAVPRGPGGLALRTGDVVDVLATFATTPTEAPEPVEPTFPVARGAVVVGVEDDAVTLAVRPEEAARVAFALTAGTVALVLGTPSG